MPDTLDRRLSDPDSPCAASLRTLQILLCSGNCGPGLLCPSVHPWTDGGAGGDFKPQSHLGLSDGDTLDDSKAFPYGRSAGFLRVGDGSLWPGDVSAILCPLPQNLCKASGNMK